MAHHTLNAAQRSVVKKSANARLFLEGPAGTGKTTAGVACLLRLLEAGVAGNSILVLVPQRTLGAPYSDVLRSPSLPAGGMPALLTVGGLAQRMVEMFWPLAAHAAGFTHPDEPPVFLTMETAQYYMAHLVRPLLEEGIFDGVTIERNRLYSQIIDNLNKAAVVGFPYTEIGERLKSAWGGEPAQLRIYEDAQSCASRFREYCLAHNLLDFSLQLEVFRQVLWPASFCRNYLTNTFQHLIYDNIEEDTPIAHDLVREWLPEMRSALLIYDTEAGYRRFLGADPQSAYSLREDCQKQAAFTESLVVSPEIHALTDSIGQYLTRSKAPLLEPDPRPAIAYEYQRFYPEMLDWIAGQIDALVHQEGLAPGEIVVLAPFLSDSLRFSLVNRLERLDIPARSHRPSRSLREEPAALCLLTLAMLAHPEWGLLPTKFDVAYTLMQAIAGMDLVRAQLLAEIVYRVREGLPTLSSFDQIAPETQERITYLLGTRYEHLRLWLLGYHQDAQAAEAGGELDHFLSLLFGEVLSQPGYGFHYSYDAGEVTANLVESVQKFRWVAAPDLAQAGIPLGKEYIEMVQDGVIAAQYIGSWQLQAEDAVLLAPAHTFLMSNRPATVQFWLDVGSRSWAERLYQPLTHPYVLSRHWHPGVTWGDADEVEANQQVLHHLAIGLLRRCRQRIYLGLSELGEQGYEQRGPLLRTYQRVLQEFVNHFGAEQG